MIIVIWSVNIVEMSSCIMMPNMKVFILKKLKFSLLIGFESKVDSLIIVLNEIILCFVVRMLF